MSSLFGSSHAMPNKPAALGIQPTQTSTNQAAIPLPWFAGTRRLPIHWLCNAQNEKTEEVTDDTASGGKGGGAAGGISGYDYYATVAGAFCHGPVDAVLQIWFNSVKVWDGNHTRQPDEDHTEIDIEDYGSAKIYWGTESQMPADALDGHPGYRGICYAVFEQLYFGRDTTNAPNIEVVLRRNVVLPGGFVERALLYGSEANPACCMVELLTNRRFGLGLPPAMLDAGAINTASAALQQQGLGISPLVTEMENAMGLMLRFTEYFDGYLTGGNDGPVKIFVAGDPGDPAQYPLIGEYDLTERPVVESAAWHDTANEIVCRFTNRPQQFQADVYTFRDEAAIIAAGAPIQKTLDREWVTSMQLAAAFAARYARLSAVPLLKTTLSLRKAAAMVIQPGGFIRFTYQNYDTTLVLRVLAKTVPDDHSQSVKVECMTDRYVDAELDYTPDDLPIDEDAIINPQQLLAVKYYELPAWMAVRFGTGVRLLMLPARASQFEVSTALMASDADDADSYLCAGAMRKFALHGHLATELLDTYPAKRITINASGDDPAMVVTPDGTDTAWPASAGNNIRWMNGRFLVFIENEIISYQTATVGEGGTVEIRNVVRGYAGTQIAHHDVGAEVFMIAARDMQGFFSQFFYAGNTVDLRAIPSTYAASAALADAPTTRLQLIGRRWCPMPPINISANGDNSNPKYIQGRDIVVRWDGTYVRPGEGSFWSAWNRINDSADTHALLVDEHIGFVLNFGGARWVKLVPGTQVFTYTDAMIQADFGGYPASIAIQLWAIRQGFLSEQLVSVTVSLTSNTSYSPKPQAIPDIFAAVDPVTILDRAWTVAHNEWGIALPYGSTKTAGTRDIKSVEVPAYVNANIAALQAWFNNNYPELNIQLWPATLGGTPDIALQHDMEELRRYWNLLNGVRGDAPIGGGVL